MTTSKKPARYVPSAVDRNVFDSAFAASAKDTKLTESLRAALEAAAVDGRITKEARRSFDAGWLVSKLGMPRTAESFRQALIWIDVKDSNRPEGFKAAYDDARRNRNRILARLGLMSDDSRGGAREMPKRKPATATVKGDVAAAAVSTSDTSGTSDTSDTATKPARPAAPTGVGLTVPVLVNRAEWLTHAADLAAFMSATLRKNRKAVPGPLRIAYEAFIAAVKSETAAH